jgi:hypothetical protein
MPADATVALAPSDSANANSDGMDLVIIDYLKARHTELYVKLRTAVSFLKRKK